MAEATIKWLEEKRFVGVDSTNHGIVIAAAGEDGLIGVKPSELLLLSLGSCSAYDVVGILKKKRELFINIVLSFDIGLLLRMFLLHIKKAF